MKKITNLLFIITLSISLNTLAQDGYTYSLAHNGSYSFTIQAVPNTSTNDFATSVQSYGFTIIVPDGVTIDTGSATSLGGAANTSFFNGTDVGEPTIDGYLITETLGSPVSLTAPSAATNTDLYTFTVNGSPTAGNIYILENNSTLANDVTPLKSFMQADMIDNGIAEFVNVVDSNAAAVTAPSTFNFATLSVDDFQLKKPEITIFPIPAKSEITISSSVEIDSYSLFDFSGKKVLSDSLSEDKKVDLSKLSTGVYIIKMKLENKSIISKQIIKH